MLLIVPHAWSCSVSPCFSEAEISNYFCFWHLCQCFFVVVVYCFPLSKTCLIFFFCCTVWPISLNSAQFFTYESMKTCAAACEIFLFLISCTSALWSIWTEVKGMIETVVGLPFFSSHFLQMLFPFIPSYEESDPSLHIPEEVEGKSETFYSLYTDRIPINSWALVISHFSIRKNLF